MPKVCIRQFVLWAYKTFIVEDSGVIELIRGFVCGNWIKGSIQRLLLPRKKAIECGITKHCNGDKIYIILSPQFPWP